MSIKCKCDYQMSLADKVSISLFRTFYRQTKAVKRCSTIKMMESVKSIINKIQHLKETFACPFDDSFFFNLFKSESRHVFKGFFKLNSIKDSIMKWILTLTKASQSQSMTHEYIFMIYSLIATHLWSNVFNHSAHFLFFFNIKSIVKNWWLAMVKWF